MLHAYKVDLLKELKLQPQKYLVAAMKKLDLQRIRKAEKELQVIEKKIRQGKPLAKRQLEDLNQEEEDPEKPS